MSFYPKSYADFNGATRLVVTTTIPEIQHPKLALSHLYHWTAGGYRGLTLKKKVFGV